MSRVQLLVMIVSVCLGLCAFVAAQEPSADAERARHLARMRELAGSIQVLADADQSDSAVKLKDEPVLRYADDTRQTFESSLWIWSNGGRPAAIVALEYYPTDPQGPRWLYEIASLSPKHIAAKRIAAEREGSFQWTATEPGLSLQLLADAPPPAEKEVRRLAQMKQLRGRFTADENASSASGGRIELRPLATPLLRYADAEQGILDAAIFSFANGTNPELLLILEARKAEGKLAWHYALIHMSGEPVAVQLDGKDIWQRPGDVPPAVRPSYVNGYIATKREEK
jgi:hypothetical protein